MIIGVVAAVTVPSLMNNTNAQEYRSKVKKSISALNRALTLHYALEGLSVRDYSTAEDLINNLFKKRMNVIDVDYSTFPNHYNLTENCYPNSQNSFVTQDGFIFCIEGFRNNNTFCDENNKVSCGYTDFPNLFIDVNGLKKPNRATERSSSPFDIHYALIYNKKIEPFGPTMDIMSDSNDVHIGIYPEEEEPEGPPPVS